MYSPEWKGPIEGYTTNFINRQGWRVLRTHDFKDCMQEAYLVFMRCAERYPIIDTGAHFMSLYKRALTNHMHDLAEKATSANRMVPEVAQDREEGGEWARDSVGELENLGQLLIMLQQAPREVMMVINLFLNAPTELLELASQAWAAQGRRKADGNAMISRLLGIPAERDVLGQIERYFNS